MSKGVIFQELHVVGGDIIQFIPFVCAFYAFESSMFYSYCSHEGDIIIIPSAMGICQGDPLGGLGGGGGALLVLAHFRALCSKISYFPSCLFPSIANDIHIIGPLSIISYAYEHFRTKLHVIGLSIQLQKCVTWSPSTLLPNFNTPSQFTTSSKGIRVLGVPLGTLIFTSSFIKNALLKDVQHPWNG